MAASSNQPRSAALSHVIPSKPRSNNPRLVWAISLCVTGLCYTAIFAATRSRPFLLDIQAAALNCGSLALTALSARAALKRWVLPLTGWKAWAAHGVAAGGFAFAWTWLLYVATGIAQSGSVDRFSVIPFLQGPAQQWQLMQGLFAYAAVAALTALEDRPAGAMLVLDAASPEFRQRFLAKSDGDVVSLAARDIVSISGADDYAEVVTLQGRHLVSTTLGDFEAALDPARFLRVHRSVIANLDYIVRAEPAGGGRMTLFMSDGPNLAVSRAGAKRLRERLL